MSINKDSHLQSILATLEELLQLSTRTAAPSDNCFQYIGTIVDNTLGLLTSAANGLDNGDRRIVFDDDKNWISLMQAVHRSFLSTIQSSVEMALSELCDSVEIKNKKKIDALLEELDDKLTSSQKRTIRALSPQKPSFNDYLEGVLNTNSTMLNPRKVVWRKFFDCLSILRNKVSHSDCSLSSSERDRLMQNGFSSVVKGSELQINSRIYAQICNHLIRFFQELGCVLKV